MRMSRWEKPEVALTNVTYEHLTVGTHHRYAGFSVQHVSPFVGRVPMEFAVAPGGQAHINASDIPGGRQFTLGHLMGPTPSSTRFLTKSKEYHSGTMSP